MKLSMWMIANQMTELDVKLEISEDAPAVLNSARLAYATNCVHVYQENDYVVCDGEGDRIYIYDMDVTRAFEPVSYTHLDVYKRQVENSIIYSIHHMYIIMSIALYLTRIIFRWRLMR